MIGHVVEMFRRRRRSKKIMKETIVNDKSIEIERWRALLGSQVFIEIIIEHSQPRDVLSLASSSKFLFNSWQPIICSTFYFKQPRKFEFSYYKPTKLTQVHTITSSIKNSTSITHIIEDPSLFGFLKSSLSSCHSPSLPVSLLSYSSGPLSKLLSSLPLSLTHLIYNDNGDLSHRLIYSLPPSLVSFTINTKFSTSSSSAIPFPDSLQHLKFCGLFNYPIILPPKLKSLEIVEMAFKHKLELPLSLSSLSLNSSYNIPLLLPSSLTELSCGGSFYKSHQIPLSISNLKINNLLSNDRISGDFLSFNNLKELFLMGACANSLSLPPSITHLTLQSNGAREIITPLPNLIYLNSITNTDFLLPLSLPSLRTLDVCNDPKELSLSVSSLSMDVSSATIINSLPDSLKFLKLGYYNSPVSHLPSSLTHLYKFGNSQNLEENLSLLSPSITHLEFSYSFNQRIFSLPSSITLLVFGHKFNQPLPLLPSSLTHLKFQFSFNQELVGLPNKLTHLILGNMFDKSLESLPQGLRFLKINSANVIYADPVPLPRYINTYMVAGCRKEASKKLISKMTSSSFPCLSTFSFVYTPTPTGHIEIDPF